MYVLAGSGLVWNKFTRALSSPQNIVFMKVLWLEGKQLKNICWQQSF